jgi:hypothetical protein
VEAIMAMKRVLLGVLGAGAIAVALGHCGGTATTTGPGADAAATDAPSGADAPVAETGGNPEGGDACGGCRTGLSCCGSQCVNTDNDPANCGGCGIACMGATPFCDGTCVAAPCDTDAGSCSGGTACCGKVCCKAGQICCKSEGPIPGPPACSTPTAGQPACPVGCAPLCVSDRNEKRDVVSVEGRDVLEALAGVPMSTWSYKTDKGGVRHLGPMAQDLHAAFGLAGDGKTYDPIDAHGIAFASIQALYEMQLEQEARIERLEQENARLRQQCEAPR